MKIVTVIGARPQFIKAGVISRAIENYNEAQQAKSKINEVIIHTGQHYDQNMSAVFFAEMQIPRPKYNLQIGGKSHGAMTGRMVEKIEAILSQETPDVLMVYGDTNSTLAGALAAAKLHLPIAHIEAGLRSYDMGMPEEINRVLVDRISKWLFCPTHHAVENLAKEGYDHFSSIAIKNVGDVMYDAALFYQGNSHPSDHIERKIRGGGYYLATVHRQGSTENYETLSSIMRALNHIAKRKKMIFPLHPRTQRYLLQFSIDAPNIDFIAPVGYFDMIALLKNCSGIFTDSGGLQKEAYYFKKRCITLRDQTEWTELIDWGFNKLVGANYDKIVAAEREMHGDILEFRGDLYGDGDAGIKIIKILAENF